MGRIYRVHSGGGYGNYGAKGSYNSPDYSPCPKCHDKSIPHNSPGWELFEISPFENMSRPCGKDEGLVYDGKNLYIFHRCSMCGGSGEIIIGSSEILEGVP